MKNLIYIILLTVFVSCQQSTQSPSFENEYNLQKMRADSLQLVIKELQSFSQSVNSSETNLSDSIVYDENFFKRYEEILVEEYKENALVKNSLTTELDSTVGGFIDHASVDVMLSKELFKFWRPDIQMNS